MESISVLNAEFSRDLCSTTGACLCQKYMWHLSWPHIYVNFTATVTETVKVCHIPHCLKNVVLQCASSENVCVLPCRSCNTILASKWDGHLNKVICLSCDLREVRACFCSAADSVQEVITNQLKQYRHIIFATSSSAESQVAPSISRSLITLLLLSLFFFFQNIHKLLLPSNHCWCYYFYQSNKPAWSQSQEMFRAAKMQTQYFLVLLHLPSEQRALGQQVEPRDGGKWMNRQTQRDAEVQILKLKRQKKRNP